MNTGVTSYKLNSFTQTQFGFQAHFEAYSKYSSPRHALPMNSEKAIEPLKQFKPLLESRFGVLQLALFGSTARDAARPGSDVDILVNFSGKVTSAQYFCVQFYIEDLICSAVDLVTQKALRKELHTYTEQEALHV
ncbi:MAG: nucleotidyltransferase family protein [Polaromonas sp.]